MEISSLNTTLSTISFYILLAVADHPLHAYGIRDQITDDSSGDLIVATGTLYPALTRLVAEGMLDRIESHNPRAQIKHCYRITPVGKRKLTAEARRYSRLALHARHKLGENVLRPQN